MAPSDNKRTSVVPTIELMKISEKLTAVATGVDSIKNDLFPPVVKAAGEARDGVIELKGWNRDISRRVDGLENEPPPIHECKQERTIRDHNGNITAHEREIAGLSKWRWWLMGIVTVAVISGTSWAISSARDITQVQADVRSNDRIDIRQEEHIEALENGQRRMRDEVIKEVRQVPTKVKQELPSSVLDAIEDQPLTDWEKRQVRDILRRAEKRNGEEKHES